MFIEDIKMTYGENTPTFADVIVAASNYYHISPSIVEKDYFVTVVLNKLKEKILSDCFNDR